MGNFISDIVIILSRAFLWMIRLLFLCSTWIFWKLFPVGSKPYQIVRKIVRSRNTERIDSTGTDLVGWQEILYRNSNTPTRIELNRQKKFGNTANLLFGVCLFVKGLDHADLERTISSIKSQSFSNWKILFSFDPEMTASDQVEIMDLVKEHLPQEKYLLPNSGELDVKVDFVLQLSDGDSLRPDCLFRLAEHPEYDLISFDITLPGLDGKSRPWLRPAGLSPELMISANYLSHAAVSRDAVKNLFGTGQAITSMCSGNDFSLFFQLIQNQSIRHRHITRVLMDQKDSLAVDGDDIRINTIDAHASRMGLQNVKCDLLADGNIHLKWKTDGEKVSIIIPSKDKPELIRTCIESIRSITNYTNYEIVIVDNGSHNTETLAYYEQLSSDNTIVLIRYPEAFNYSKAINLGAAHANGKYLLFLNNDIRIHQADWLTELVQWAMLPEIGVVGPQLLYPNGTVQHAGVVLDPNRLISHVFCHQLPTANGPHGSVEWYRNYIGVTGACQMIRKDLFELLGGYDEQFKLTFNDIDICQRAIKMGYRVVYNPFSQAYHYESSTRTSENPPEDVNRAYSKFKDILLSGDPFFSDQLFDSFHPRVRVLQPDRRQLIRIRIGKQ
jgi:GT2 family glycosyltransferase